MAHASRLGQKRLNDGNNNGQLVGCLLGWAANCHQLYVSQGLFFVCHKLHNFSIYFLQFNFMSIYLLLLRWPSMGNCFCNRIDSGALNILFGWTKIIITKFWFMNAEEEIVTACYLLVQRQSGNLIPDLLIWLHGWSGNNWTGRSCMHQQGRIRGPV